MTYALTCSYMLIYRYRVLIALIYATKTIYCFITVQYVSERNYEKQTDIIMQYDTARTL